MQFSVQFFGAAGEVTGSCYLIRAGSNAVLLECGLIQGSEERERRNHEPFPFDIAAIDAVILSHAHIDHSGQFPRLVKHGYRGLAHVQNATKALCEVMLPDSGYLNERDAEWQNRKNRAAGLAPVEPLYTREDAELSLERLEGIPYDQWTEIVPGLSVRFHDAGHILGSAIVELRYLDGADSRTLVFSGDLGFHAAPVMNPPAVLRHADLVLMESTYGDRQHREAEATLEELTDVFSSAHAGQGNILIPAFTVGRTQDLLYLMSENYERWKLAHWQIILDSPMAIEATNVYAKYRHLYGAKLFPPGSTMPALPNFVETRSPEESMAINDIRSGAIIIAGSGMCSGGRIRHHLKNNVWRPECHLLIVGYQAYGTLGRRLVDGAKTIKLWGNEYRVRLHIHTIGGLSAHADQADLLAWYRGFENRPPVCLVHGEPGAQKSLAAKIMRETGTQANLAEYAQEVAIGATL